jgi:hypothetical protein
VSSCEGNSFIQEEQLRVAILRHHDASAAFEFENAGDPTAAGVLPNDLAVVIVECSAAVAQERSPGANRDNLTERRNTVLERHSDSQRTAR